MKAMETNLLEEKKRLKQEKQALEVDLGQVKKERDLARAQIASTLAEKSYEMKLMEESYKDEISRLQKRLRWYAENQELLDKDASRLRGAKEEIDKLKLEVIEEKGVTLVQLKRSSQVDKLRSETGNQSTQQKKRLKDRAADAKRIQDLERQALFALAEASPSPSEPAVAAAYIKAGKELGCLLFRIPSISLTFQKLQYEKRIGELEQLLAYKLLNEPQKFQDNITTLQATLEKELCSVNEAHKITIKNLQAEIDSLKNQLVQLGHQKNATDNAELQSLEYQVEQAHTKARMVRLNQEVIAKNKEIQDLTKTVERLQKERRIMLSGKNSSDKTDNKENSTGILKRDTVGSNQRNTKNEEFFPATHDDKIYQPNTFADCHISEVLQENKQLKDELEKLSLELSQQRVTSQAALANSESLARRTKEDLEEYIAALKASHQKELEKILCQHAMEHSTSKVAELNSKISTQEPGIKTSTCQSVLPSKEVVSWLCYEQGEESSEASSVSPAFGNHDRSSLHSFSPGIQEGEGPGFGQICIKHLQQQVHEFRRDQEALAVSQKREEILQKEVTEHLKNFLILDNKAGSHKKTSKSESEADKENERGLKKARSERGRSLEEHRAKKTSKRRHSTQQGRSEEPALKNVRTPLAEGPRRKETEKPTSKPKTPLVAVASGWPIPSGSQIPAVVEKMAKLLEELGEARERQNPEMKHFVCLERKIKQLETRYEQREQELQQVIQETRHIAEVQQIQEIEKWRKLALLKNQELEKFRIELDSMLDILRQLQKQGVIIPVSSSNMPESYWKI
ncbi:hypothetical protein JD844_024131 [Phrynosoma platyrhinos]|uniref:Centrosomal protein of 162 kDa n=1 Tax=Phrynosoma platyrhinos TaxID=52577 RepID=A0ABQ7SXM6_PHRPL|nr:hypothetical protein JD844_024131 [Phrynosoma platyrhinos]